MSVTTMARMGMGVTLALMLIMAIEPSGAWAADGGGIQELSTGVQKLEATMSGPVLKAIAVIALVVGGLMLAFGGELGSIAKTLAQTFLAIGLAGGATSIATNVLGIRGAEIGPSTSPEVTVTAEPSMQAPEASRDGLAQ